MRIGSACSGIGGIDLGLERAGLGETVWQIEREPFCQEILARHWPNVERFDDVKTAHPPPVDLLCAGFPCQPVSVAGRRLAQADPRWLWPDIARLIDECTPGIVVVENVPGLRTAGLRDVLADLAARGFDAEWTHFRASQLGAPHRRDRFWLVAAHPDRVRIRYEQGWFSGAIRTARTAVAGGVPSDTAGSRCGTRSGEERQACDGSPGPGGLLPADADADRLRRLEQAIRLADERGWSRLCGWRIDSLERVDDGLSGRLGAARKALGNAVVVHCAHLVGLALKEALA